MRQHLLFSTLSIKMLSSISNLTADTATNPLLYLTGGTPRILFTILTQQTKSFRGSLFVEPQPSSDCLPQFQQLGQADNLTASDISTAPVSETSPPASYTKATYPPTQCKSLKTFICFHMRRGGNAISSIPNPLKRTYASMYAAVETQHQASQIR